MLGFSPLASSPLGAIPHGVDKLITITGGTSWSWTSGAVSLRLDDVISVANPTSWTWGGGSVSVAVITSQSFATNVAPASWTWSSGSTVLSIVNAPHPRGPYIGKLIKTPVFMRGFGVRYQ